MGLGWVVCLFAMTLQAIDGRSSGDVAAGTDVRDLALRLMGKPESGYEHVVDGPDYDMRYAINASRLRTELGWAPRYTSFEDGLAATIDWYRANEDWWRPMKAATEAMYAEHPQPEPGEDGADRDRSVSPLV